MGTSGAARVAVAAAGTSEAGTPDAGTPDAWCATATVMPSSGAGASGINATGAGCARASGVTAAGTGGGDAVPASASKISCLVPAFAAPDKIASCSTWAGSVSVKLDPVAVYGHGADRDDRVHGAASCVRQPGTPPVSEEGKRKSRAHSRFDRVIRFSAAAPGRTWCRKRGRERFSPRRTRRTTELHGGFQKNQGLPRSRSGPLPAGKPWPRESV